MEIIFGKCLKAAIVAATVCWNFSAQAQQLSVKKYNIDKVAVKWNNMEARLTVDADYPEGSTPAEKTLQRWLGETFTSGNHHITSGQQLLERVEAEFCEMNSIEGMKDMAEDGAEEGNWYYNHRAKKEYENTRFVSYTYSWDAYLVGNATSGAGILDMTVSKTDGRILGWEMFSSLRQLKKLIDRQLVSKFGEDGADIYLRGTPPMPGAPLFLKDGIRFDFGDYSIVTAHVYEEMGEYPFVFLTYAEVGQLLTDEAKAVLGLSGQTPTINEPEPASTVGVNVQRFRNCLKRWDDMHNLRQTDDLEYEYAPSVDYYGSKFSGEKVRQSKAGFLQKTPDYEQVSYRLKVTRIDDSHVRCDFQKRTTAKGKTQVYPSYLIYVTKDNGLSWQIERESDLVTDRNLERMRSKNK